MYQNDKIDGAIAAPNRKINARLIQNDNVLIESVKSFTITAGSEEITIGNAISSYVQATVDKQDVLLSGKEVSLEIGLETDGEMEYIPMGVYTIQNPKIVSNKISFTAYDCLTSKCNSAYYSKLTYPVDALDVLKEIEAMTGVSIDTTGLQKGITLNKRAVTDEDEDIITAYVNPFDGYTYKETIGFIAGLFGKFAVSGRTGNIEFRWYQDISYEIPSRIFYNDLQETEENFAVAKLTCDNTEATLVSGSGATGINMQNPVMTQNLLDAVYLKVKDIEYAPTTLRFIGDPRLEIGDIVTAVKNDDTQILIPIVSLQTSYDGGLMQTLASYGNTAEEEDADTQGPLTQMVERISSELMLTKNLMTENLTATNAEIKNLSGDILNFKTGEFENLKSDVANFKTTTTENLNATNAKISSLESTTIKAKDLEAEVGKFGYLKVDQAEITYATIKNLEATDGKIDNLSGDLANFKTGEFKDLKSDVANFKETTTENLTATNAKIETLEADTVKTKNLEAEVGKFGYLKSNELESKVGTFGYLKASDAELEYATITNLNAATGKISKLESNQATFEEATAKNFNATNARITNIEADYVKATEIEAKVGTFGYVKTTELESKVGTFGYLKADDAKLTYATITNLNAANAAITKLQTKDAEIDKLVATKASITDLNAAIGRVGVLESSYADLNTLVNGNLTSDNIQNLTLTSKNTTIENGMIKNAMIENLSFDKITGVDINTTNLTVHSNDGKSKWSDNTIQISDANRVRVQIGKDASNDYSMSVWDKSGKLIWDALGATENTIQRKIIRDSVVADDAAISGTKLNIPSVIKEVNGSTTKLKSSTISMNDQNQTLDVIFNEMETTVADNLSSAKLYADGKLSDAQKYALEQANNALSSAKTYADSAVNNLEIGGRNLATNTSKDYSNPYTAFDGGSNICPTLSKKVYTSGLSVGDKVTVHLYYKYTDIVAAEGKTASCWIQGAGNVTGWSSGAFTNSRTLTLNGSGEYEFLYTFTVAASQLQNEYWTINIRHNYVKSGSVQWKLFKVERGTKATDWTPAPEDTQSQIDNITEITTSHTTSISTMRGQISSLISEDTAIKGNYDALLSRYNATVSTVDSMKTTIGEHATILNNQNDSITAVTTKANTIETNLAGTTQTVSEVKSSLAGTQERVTKVETSLTGLTTRVSNTETNLAGLEIGGRNLYYLKDFDKYAHSCTQKYNVLDGEITLIASGSDLYFGEVMGGGDTWTNNKGPLMDVSGATHITFTISNTLFTKNFYNFLDGDKKALSGYKQLGTNTGVLDVPSSAKYLSMRIGYGSAVSGTTYKLRVKIEKGNRATDWTPAPEDVDQQITAVETVANQNADRFKWLVKSGTSSTDFELTDRTATLVANAINLKGLVTFSGLDNGTKDKINSPTSGNLITVNPANPSSSYDGVAYNVATDDKGAKCIQWGTNNQPYLIFTSYPQNIFRAGDRLYYDLVVPNWSSTVSVPLGIWFYDKNKKYLSQKTVSVTLTGGAWNRLTGYIDMPAAGSAWSSVYYYNLGIENKSNAVIGLTTDSFMEKTSSYSTAYTDAVKTDVIKTAASDATTKANAAQTAAKEYAKNAVDWVTTNGLNTTSLTSMVKKWTDGAISDTTQINGGWLKTDTVTASKIAIGDFTNYCDMNAWNTYGFTREATADGEWFSKTTYGRDNAISEMHSCEPGQIFYVEYDISNTIKEGDTYKYAGIMLFGYDGTKTVKSYVRNAGVTATADGPITHISTRVTMPSETRFFRVYLQIEGHPTFTGDLKIRNISVRKAVTGKVIVDGTIIAAKLAANTITADKIATNTITAASGVIADAAITTAKIANTAITTAKIADAAITSAKITDASITNAKIADATIESAKINSIDAAKIKTGQLSADRIDVSSVFAKDITATGTIRGVNLVGAKGTFTGAVTENYLSLSSNGNTQGYFKIATIKITNGYQNLSLVIGVNHRASGYTECTIQFSNASSTDPSLYTFKKSGATTWAIIKTATSTWDLYMGKAESWDWGRVCKYENPMGISVTWSGASADIPDGVTWAAQTITDKTVIDGSIITTGQVSADRIDVTGIFAKDVTATGTITGAKLSGATGTFSGKITAKEGTIGKYTITDNWLTTGSGSTATGIGGNQAFWAGSSSSNEAPFRVAYNGTLVATNADITGKITATSGTFTNVDITGKLIATGGRIGKFNVNADNSYMMAGSGSTAVGLGGNQAFWAGGEDSNNASFHVGYGGDITATNGHIANFKIQKGYIFNEITIGTAKSCGIGAGAAKGGSDDWIFWAGNGAFKVDINGALKATNANITGVVNATSGTFTNVDIQSGKVGGLSLANGVLTGTGNYTRSDKKLALFTSTISKDGLKITSMVDTDITTSATTVIDAGGIELKNYDGGCYIYSDRLLLENDEMFVSLNADGVDMSYVTSTYTGQVNFHSNTSSFNYLSQTTNTMLSIDDNEFSVSSNNINTGKGHSITLNSSGITIDGDSLANSHKHWYLASGDYRAGIGSSTTRFCTYSTDLSGGADVKLSLGYSNARWTQVYAQKSTINTSDQREKEAIKAQDNRYEKLFDALKPVTYKWRGEGHDRTHTGFIAQQVKSAMDVAGLTPIDFAAFCYDDFTKDPEWTPEQTGGVSDRYSLAYEEFISLNTHMIQKTRKEMSYQVGRIDMHEAIITDLQTRLLQAEKTIKENQRTIKQLTQALA